MAEGVIGALLLKMGIALATDATNYAESVIADEASAMRGLLREIKEMKGELESLQSFLREAERFRDVNGGISNFIKQTRSIAYQIEDIIDEFTYKMGMRRGGTLSKIIKRSRNIKTWRKLTVKLQDLKITLKNITTRRERYDTRGIDKEARPQQGSGSLNRAESAHFMKEDDLVGIDRNKELLIKWLEDKQQQSKIISVWGMGGLGKTTLVTQVYNTVKTNFDSCAWVSVSQSYKTDDLLRRIIKEFHREHKKEAMKEAKEAALPNLETMDYISLVRTIHNYIQDKRYILILDDMWDSNAWFDIKDILLVGKSSRIVLTTRIHNVALLANEHCMLELKPLQEHDSWDLFCKRAFWKNENKICPSGLKHLAEKFLEKCSGLPIVIVSIASLLSLRGQNEFEWEKVYKDLEWQLTKLDRVNSVLKLSLDDLPHYLRNCFLYCTIFPQDYKIRRNKTLRLWIAQGFVEERERRTMEEVAEDYLKELIHRCLLQVAERNEFGRVRACRMHDIFRVLALHKSKEESFCMAYDSSSTWLGGQTRHLSIRSCQKAKDFVDQLDKDGVQLRSFLVFDKSINLTFLNTVFRSFKLLSALELHGVPMKRVPNEVFNLFNLRFLGLSSTGVEELPRSIARLQYLQTLDAADTRITRLPKEITTLQKLRHLFFTNIEGVVAPKGIWDLNCLQTLHCIEASSENVRKMGALTELKTFIIVKLRADHCVDLCLAVTKMTRLINLVIVAKDGLEELQLETLHLPPSLLKFSLFGKLEKESLPRCLKSLGSLKHLKLLVFAWSRFDEDPIPFLQVLHGLCYLAFVEAYDGENLFFPATSFPKLKRLIISDAPQLKQIEIERGAMQSLNELKLSSCPEFKMLPKGLEHLAALQDLVLDNPELVEMLYSEEEQGNEINEDHTRIRCITKVTLGIERGGERVKERIQLLGNILYIRITNQLFCRRLRASISIEPPSSFTVKKNREKKAMKIILESIASQKLLLELREMANE